MGCCASSPYSRRKYRDPADLDEEYAPLRYFGTNRVGSNLVPDDIAGLPSTHMAEHLAANKDVILYTAEIDHGKSCRMMRLSTCFLCTPWGVVWMLSKGLANVCDVCSCDEMCCWVRKEYSTRTYFRIYANRIEVNEPRVRFPFSYGGCGSWNSDNIVANPFDRGAFGFERVSSGSYHYILCCCPVYGQVVARHRCQCNGPLWNRMFTDCGGWWCDEWPCKMLFCVFQYTGLADADETSFAASIALQAYFEGRAITPADMERCLEFWRKNVSERTDPIGRKRPVCCEPFCVPTCDCSRCYVCTHPKRNIPYQEDGVTSVMEEAYFTYEAGRAKQIDHYQHFHAPIRHSTLCRGGGCRRACGRKGFFFCTEGCNHCDRKAGEPAPPFEEHDFDDEFDASTVLIKVIGPPPANVVIRRWRWDPEKGENYLETYPEGIEADKDHAEDMEADKDQ